MPKKRFGKLLGGITTKAPDLAKKFTEEVREIVHYIKQNPQACSVRYNDVRTAVLKVFPFMVHYTIDESSKTVIITAVLHTSRDPKVWQKR